MISRLFPPLAVALITLFTFWNSLHNGFTNWDDLANFVNNPNYRGFSRDHLVWMFTSFHTGVYIPITWLTLAWDYHWWGLNPYGYHLTSVLIHTANAVLVYLLARLVFAFIECSNAPRGIGRSAVEGAAMVTALFFAIHPLRVESVSWVTERRDLVCGFFFIVTMILYWLRGSASEIKWKPSVPLILFTFVLSLLSKATSMTLPILLVLLDVFRARILEEPVDWQKILFQKAVYVAVAIPFVFLAWYGQHGINTVAPLGFFTLADRIGLAAYAIVFYVLKTLWPTGLSPLYELPFPLSTDYAAFLGSVIAVALFSLIIIMGRRRWPGVVLAWAWYLIMLFPNSGFFQTGMQRAADRYTYLPCLSFAFLVGGITAHLLQSDLKNASLRRWITGSITSILLLALIFRTYQQNGVWHDSIRLWEQAIRNDPQSKTAQTYLGTALMDQRDFVDAVPHLRQGTGSLFTSLETHNDLGVALAAQGLNDQAAREFAGVLARDPNNRSAQYNLAKLKAARRP